MSGLLRTLYKRGINWVQLLARTALSRLHFFRAEATHASLQQRPYSNEVSTHLGVSMLAHVAFWMTAACPQPYLYGGDRPQLLLHTHPPQPHRNQHTSHPHDPLYVFHSRERTSQKGCSHCNSHCPCFWAEHCGLCEQARA